MKKVLVATVFIASVAVFFAAGTRGSSEDHVTANEVVGFAASDEGVLLHYQDGTGYYIEVGQDQQVK